MILHVASLYPSSGGHSRKKLTTGRMMLFSSASISTNIMAITVSIALRSFIDANFISDYWAMFTMMVFLLVPVLVVFVFFQRYLMDGISTTGLKG